MTNTTNTTTATYYSLISADSRADLHCRHEYVVRGFFATEEAARARIEEATKSLHTSEIIVGIRVWNFLTDEQQVIRLAP